MLGIKALLIIVAGVITISSVPLSESVLWDLLITVDIQNAPLLENENPLIIGQVIDHAGKPVTNATIQIRSGQNTVFTTSDESGKFSYEFTSLKLIPGEHVVNVVATSLDGKIGLAGQNFQVKGELSASSHTARLLDTEEAKKYLNSNPEDHANNPIGITLYNYYQKLQAKFLEEESIQKSIDESKVKMQQTKAISGNLTQKIIDEKNPGAGTFAGVKKDIFIDNLDPSIRDLVSRQMNFTVSVFEEAQRAMNQVLENGGTYQEARMAYFEKASVTREMMDLVTYQNYTSELFNEITNSTLIQNSTGIINATSISNLTTSESLDIEEVAVNLNGTQIHVGMSGTTIFLNVNGTLIEFLVNGTQIIPITNSTQN